MIHNFRPVRPDQWTTLPAAHVSAANINHRVAQRKMSFSCSPSATVPSYYILTQLLSEFSCSTPLNRFRCITTTVIFFSFQPRHRWLPVRFWCIFKFMVKTFQFTTKCNLRATVIALKQQKSK